MTDANEKVPWCSPTRAHANPDLVLAARQELIEDTRREIMELRAKLAQSNRRYASLTAEIASLTAEIDPPSKGATEHESFSVQPAWCRRLSLQQQSVLLLAARGPDGVGKHDPCKRVHIAYRATVLVSAKYGRPLLWGEQADTFMSLHEFADDRLWNAAVAAYFAGLDQLPAHYAKHFMHGVEIVGYKHPEVPFRDRWHELYRMMASDLHLNMETEGEMDERLGDWGRKHWGRHPSDGEKR